MPPREAAARPTLPPLAHKHTTTLLTRRTILRHTLRGAEEVIEPELPIIDPHHHLWDLRGKDYGYGPKGQVVYQLDECLEDMRDGHNVVKTVFLQVMADGQFPNWMEATELPPSLRPLGEVEYCQGIAAICDAERPADVPRICAGIVG